VSDVIRNIDGNIHRKISLLYCTAGKPWLLPVDGRVGGFDPNELQRALGCIVRD
jgi:hypothetical protein